MRSAAICSLVAALLALAGCGGGGGGPPVTADASGGSPPPPPGAPGAPGAPEGAPPSDGTAPMNDAPPGEPMPEGGATSGTPDNYAPPTDPANQGTPDGTPPGEGVVIGPDGNPIDPAMLQPRRPKTFEEVLAETLQAGHEKEWLRLIRTNLIASPAAWANQLQKDMAWVPGLRRPALGTRFGIGVLYVNASSLPRDFEGSPQPIGSSELAAAMATFGQSSAENSGGGEEGGRRRRGRPAEGAAPVQGEVSGEPNSEQRGQSKAHDDLVYFTGDFGKKLVEALKGKIESGEYGAIYKQAAEALAAGPRGQGDPNNPEGGVPSDTGTPDAPGGQGPGGRGARAEADPNRLGLAVVWLGKTNNRDELDKWAQEAGVDLLVTFELTLTKNNVNDFVNNKTRVRIAPAKITAGKREEPFVASAILENRVVMQAREKEKEGKEDPVDKEVAKIIEALDQKCKGVAFPAGVSPDAIKRRVAALVAEKPADPLPALVEARYYVVKGLLPEDDLNNAGMALMGGPQYAQLVASAPGAGIGPQIGGALSLSSVLNVLHGLNDATGVAKHVIAAGPASPPPSGNENGAPARKGRSKGKGRPAGQQP